MRIAFIRPSMFGEPSSDVMMPLVFTVIRPLTPPGIQIDFYDERAEELPADIPAPIVALTVETFAARRAYDLGDRFRAEGKKVIMGGFHPSLVSDECLEHADAVIIGDAEDTWPELLDDLDRGSLKKRYVSTGNFSLADTKYDYSVIKSRHYRLIGMIQYCRGCKFSCDFCSIHAFYHDGIRFRSLEDTVTDIKNLKQKYVFFVDDNIFSDPEKASALIDAVKPLGKKWVCQISMDAARDPDLLKRMHESGCIMVLIGFESLNINNLKQMGKGANIACGDYEKIINNIYDAGLMIYGTFIIGYDGDTKETAGILMDFAMKHKFAVANFNPLMAMPGTRLYDRLAAEGRLPYPRWWIDEKYRYGDAMLVPAGMTEQELVDSCREARYAFHSFRGIVKRITNHKANSRNLTNLFVFLAAGIVSGREVRFKQGRKLGRQYENYTD